MSPKIIRAAAVLMFALITSSLAAPVAHADEPGLIEIRIRTIFINAHLNLLASVGG